MGGESNLIKKSEPNAFTIKVPPCFLLPFTTPSDLTKNKLLVVRIMILQFPIIHGLIYIFYNMRMIEDPTMSTIYFMPVMLISIIPVIWGLNILIRLVAPVVPNYEIKGKYIMVQLVLLVCKIQMVIGDLIYQNADGVRNIEVEHPMTVQHYKNGKNIQYIKRSQRMVFHSVYLFAVIIAVIILIEMVLLSIGAQKFYKTPKRSDNDDHTTTNGQTTISVIS